MQLLLHGDVVPPLEPGFELPESVLTCRKSMLHSLFVHVRVADLHTQVVLRGFDWNLILSVGTWDDQHRLMQAAAQKFLPHSALVRSFELQQNGGLLEVDLHPQIM